MSDESPFDSSSGPTTPDRITADLRDLGVAPDDLLVVHCSLSSLGRVPGGPQGAVEGLCAAVPDGTLVVPTHSTDLTDPGDWENPPVPESWYETIRERTPAYRPDATPTRGMGAIPDCLRDYDDAVRSDHPHYSFTARGAAAEAVTADHGLDFGLGEESPLAAVYERGGRVLVLGCDRGRNTSLHLAESRADVVSEVENGAPVVRGGEREWVAVTEGAYDDGDFAECATAFERERPEAAETGTVGEAEAVLYDQPTLVDFAAEWLAENR